MTSRNQMTREELIELAALDACGLLDRYDAATYTRSFLDAPAAVQDEVRELQAAIAGDESLLPDEATPSELREAVLAAVHDAMEQEAARLAPIATIGRRRRPQIDGEGEGAPAPLPRGGRGWRLLFGGPGQAWRAACFALAGALLVMLVSWAEIGRQNQEIWRAAIERRDLDWLVPEFPTLEQYLRHPDSMSVVLQPLKPAGPKGPWARVFMMETDGVTTGHLVLNDLPETDARTGKELDYVLSVTDAAGARHEVIHFRARGELSTEPLTLAGIALASNSVWSISTAAGVVLRGA
jgi:hypothetical protein